MLLSLKTALLGVIQGITEFLPISSTGHMILVDEFIRIDPAFQETFLVIVQLGSILAVLVYFHRKLFPMAALRDEQLRQQTLSLWLKTVVGVLPAIVVGGLWGSRIKALLYDSAIGVGIALFLGGIALLWIESRRLTVKVSEMETLRYGHALAIGCIQCLAMVPGVSRSASTILGALLLGTSRAVAVEYSFMLSIPTMFAATAYSILKEGASLTGQQWLATAVGFMVAFLVSWAVIAFLMDYIRRRDFKVFGWYRIVLGIIIIAWFMLRR
jgi:undecaprenyl-diphosphatase